MADARDNALKARIAKKNQQKFNAHQKAKLPLKDAIAEKAAKMAFGIDKRIAFYENLAAKVDDGLSLSEIINALGKRHRIYKDIHKIRFNAWITRLERGMSIEEMLDGWIPETEHMLIKIGAAGNMAKSLRLCVKLAVAQRDLKAKLRKALLGPVFTLLFLFGMLYGFYTGMIPILIDLLPLEEWRPFAYIFYSILKFVDDFILIILPSIAGLVYAIGLSLSNVPRSHVRSMMDIFPPWSLFRMQASASVAITIATALQLGLTFTKTIEMMQQSIKGAWLRSHLSVMEDRASKGFNIGNSMDTGMTPREELGVSDGKGLLDKETLNDLSDFSSSSSFDLMMLKIGDRVVEQSLKSMDVISGGIAITLKMAVMLCIILMVASFMLTILDFRDSLK